MPVICIDYSTNPPTQFNYTPGGGSAWGAITGTLSTQTDLQAALDTKAASAGLAAVATNGLYSSLSGVPSTFTPAAHTHAGSDIVSGVLDLARLGSGTPGAGNFLRGDGTWAAAGGAATVSTAVLALPYASKRHSVTVVDAAVSASSKIVPSLGAMLDTDPNADDDLDLLALQAIPGTGSFVLRMNFLTPIGGNVRINYMVG